MTTAPAEKILTPDPREEKLPVWARESLRALRRRVEDAEREAEDARLATNPDDTDTYIDPLMAEKIGLPRGATVTYSFGNHYDQAVNVSRRGDYLLIHGHRGITITPRASNSVEVRLVD